MENKASKNDQAKPDLSLLPKVFLEEVAKAFMVGEKKYGRYNYCKGHNASQLIAAAQRHLTAWFEGEEFDPIDGQHHLGSVGACVAMLLRQQQLGTMKDDRFINESDKPQAAESARDLAVKYQNQKENQKALEATGVTLGTLPKVHNKCR
jgi:hypothetical protein